MILAKGICTICGKHCHLTKHYGWQHDILNKKTDKEYFALVKDETKKE